MLVLALATKTSSTTTRTKNLLTLACEHVETDHSVCLFPIDIFVLITHICSTRVLSTQLRERDCVLIVFVQHHCHTIINMHTFHTHKHKHIHWHFEYPLIDFCTFNFFLPRYFRKIRSFESWVPYFKRYRTKYMYIYMDDGIYIHISPMPLEQSNWKRKAKRARIRIQILKWHILTSEK